MLAMTGRQLRDRREAAKIKAYELAAQIGVHSSRVSQIEALADVTPTTARRYLDALGQCLVATTAPHTPQEPV
jgi:transcriptional regulator with XRE-family HTH domain